MGPSTCARIFAVVVASALAVASADGQPRLQYAVFGSGVGQASGANYAFIGTMGQPLAAPGFGFWSGPATVAVAVEEEENGVIPDRFFLHQNYPNPFNPSTTIRYDVASPAHVRLEVFDLVGRRVSILVDRIQQPGIHRVDFDAHQLASGLYLCFVEMGGQRFVRSMVLMK